MVARYTAALSEELAHAEFERARLNLRKKGLAEMSQTPR